MWVLSKARRVNVTVSLFPRLIIFPPRSSSCLVCNGPHMSIQSKHVFQAVAALFTAVACLDSVVACVWDSCKSSVLFRHDSWEPGVVAVVWTVCLGCWCATLLYSTSARLIDRNPRKQAAPIIPVRCILVVQQYTDFTLCRGCLLYTSPSPRD